MDASHLTLEQILTFLLEAPLFGDLAPEGIADVVKIMQIQHLAPGQTLFQQGDVGDAWYVVFDGEVEVSRTGAERRMRPVARMSPPSCFGEMAVLDGSPRSATVEAVEETVLLRFPRGAFQELLSEGNLGAHQLVLGMARVLCERQRRLTGEVHGLLDESEEDPNSIRRRMQRMVDAYQVSE